MTPCLRGFADELLKVADVSNAEAREALRDAKEEVAHMPKSDSAMRSLRGKGAPVSRDYLASTLIGAATVPLLAIAGKKVTRALHNRSVTKALRTAKDPTVIRRLESEMQHGPLLGRARPDLPFNHRPGLTYGDLAGSAATAALGSSVVQMVRDRLSGSSSVKKYKD